MPTQICSICIDTDNFPFLVIFWGVIFSQKWYFRLLLERGLIYCFYMWSLGTPGWPNGKLFILCWYLHFHIFNYFFLYLVNFFIFNFSLPDCFNICMFLYLVNILSFFGLWPSMTYTNPEYVVRQYWRLWA